MNDYQVNDDQLTVVASILYIKHHMHHHKKTSAQQQRQQQQDSITHASSKSNLKIIFCILKNQNPSTTELTTDSDNQ